MREILTCLGTKVFMADDFSDLSYHVGTYGNKTLWVCGLLISFYLVMLWIDQFDHLNKLIYFLT